MPQAPDCLHVPIRYRRPTTHTNPTVFRVAVCACGVGVCVHVEDLCVHGRMGTLRLRGAEGLICPKFYT